MARALPVVEVHHSLNGIPSPCGYVALKAREQRGDHINTVLLTFPMKEMLISFMKTLTLKVKM